MLSSEFIHSHYCQLPLFLTLFYREGNQSTEQSPDERRVAQLRSGRAGLGSRRGRGSQLRRLVRGPAAAASLGCLLGMQKLGPHLRPAESESPFSTQGVSFAHSSLRTVAKWGHVLPPEVPLCSMRSTHGQAFWVHQEADLEREHIPEVPQDSFLDF